MLSFLYVYSDHSILECYNLFSGVELSMRSFFVIPNKGRYGRVASAKSWSGKFFQKSNYPFKVGPQNLMIEQVFMNFRVQKSELFCKYATFCSLFYQILHFFLSKLVKNTLAKFTPQLNLMPGQNLTPEEPVVRLSVPTFIRDSHSPLPIYVTWPPYVALFTNFCLGCG